MTADRPAPITDAPRRRDHVFGSPAAPLPVDLPWALDGPAGPLRWRGLRLWTTDGVLPPWYSTEAFARVLAADLFRLDAGVAPGRAPAPVHVVDIGCGSGALGLLAALRWPGSAVTLMDVCPKAAGAARASVRANRRLLRRAGSTVSVVCGDGFGAFAPAFRPAVVLCNLPFDAGPAPGDGADVWGGLAGALRDPGYRSHAAILEDLARRGTAGGRVLVAASPTIGDPQRLARLIDGAGFRVSGEATFWFATPRRRRPGAVNAYSVLALERNGS